MTKYDPQVFWRPAFDDGELFLHDREFTNPTKAKEFAAHLNQKERNRLKGKEPDAKWFVLKLTVKFAEEWKPKPSSAGTIARSKPRVVRKRQIDA